MTESPEASLRGFRKDGSGREGQIDITLHIVRREVWLGKVFPAAPGVGLCNTGWKLLAGTCFCVSLPLLRSGAKRYGSKLEKKRLMKFAKLAVALLMAQCLACSTRSLGTDGVSAIGLTPHEWAKLGQPGVSHKLLQPFVGDWDVKLTFWSSPHAKSQSSNGHSAITWILGERFVQERFSGQAAGESFEGLGLLGYDNGAREFRSLWIDSLNTAMTVASGRYLPEAQAFEFFGELYDPLRGGTKVVKSRLQVVSNDSYVFTMQDETPEGKSFTSLEMAYTRRK